VIHPERGDFASEEARVTIASTCNLQEEIVNPRSNYPPSPFDLSNVVVVTDLSKENPKIGTIRELALLENRLFVRAFSPGRVLDRD
jgi:hypothetical protein